MTVDDSSLGYSFAMRSSVGRVRSGNEDFCMASPEDGIFVVCDGMGGAAAGEIASRLAATTFVEQLKAARPVVDSAELRLRGAVKAANMVVLAHAAENTSTRGMGTTLVALLAEREKGLWLAHVGDSRCYRMREGVLTQMTRDHSLVQEQILAGQLTPEQAERSPMRNIITRAIGSTPHVEPEVQRLDAMRGDVYLLASDGLTRELADQQIASRLEDASAALEAVCEGLLDAANAAGGHDNITVLLLRMEE